MRGALYEVAGLACILLAGCSGGGAGGTSVPNNAKDFLTAYRDALCDNIGSCCGGRGGPYPYESAEACRQSFANMSVAGLSYDASKAGACLDALKASARACEFLGADGIEACHRALQGKKKPGDACQPYQCAQPTDGSSVAECALGQCQVIKRGNLDGHAGDVCDPIASSPCDDTTFCNAGICQKRDTEGDACSFDSCAEGLSCEPDTSNSAASLRCVKRGEGAACGPGAACGDSFVCDLETCRCRAPKPAGEVCSCSSECLGYCYEGRCKGDANSGGSVCQVGLSTSSCLASRLRSDAGTSSCTIPPPTQLLTPDASACRDSVPDTVSPACAACACSAGATCPAAVIACDADCWALVQCIQQKCPDFAQMAMQSDSSCLKANCSDYLGANLPSGIGTCMSLCAPECSGS